MSIERRWKDAKITDRAGEDLITVPAKVWRTTSRQTPGGQAYDYKGVCTGSAREHLVGKQNRLLEFIEGETYRVVDAIYYSVLGYVELTLLRVENQG